ncbi:MAG: cytochrome c [Planctomycetes bacterium]|jgi:mono/diheme cytochrome c family protein|nr:cytochrome c [Planctomycetota bacterium]MCL4729896.1 c-type cytochrome [Planctomycetota bacterium]
MNRLTMMLAGAMVLALLAACGGGGGNSANTAPKPKVILRKDVPADYKEKKPPAGVDLKAQAVIDKGKELYAGKGNCASCHGAGGKGDGEQGKELNPKPTDLTSAEFQSVSDAYIYWRVMTGAVGGPSGSAMTGLIGAGEEEGWQLVAYVRSLAGK